MSHDRSDEIRTLVLKQRIDAFMTYLKKKEAKAARDAEKEVFKNDDTTDRAYAMGVQEVYEKAQEYFSGKKDKPVKLD